MNFKSGCNDHYEAALKAILKERENTKERRTSSLASIVFDSQSSLVIQAGKS